MESESTSSLQQKDIKDIKTQYKEELNKNVAEGQSEQLQPCGRSYSSAKALKDHIKTVHTDTTIYSCHVSILLGFGFTLIC